MALIAILVPTPDYEEDWQPAFARKARALEAVGLKVEQRLWTDPGDLTRFDMILPLFAWGYQRQVVDWYALLDRLEEAALPVINPVPVLRWNSDKSYLANLQAKGVDVVPTIDVAALAPSDLAAAHIFFDSDRLVIKPPVSGGADGTVLLSRGDPLPAAATGRRMLVQPLMAGIQRHGEYSLFFFDRQFSHAIVKRPAAGDFRVQSQFGGREDGWEPTPAALALAKAALAVCPAPPVYARVDMVDDHRERLHIMELELIEPSLFLNFAADKGEAFARAVLAAVKDNEVAGSLIRDAVLPKPLADG